MRWFISALMRMRSWAVLLFCSLLTYCSLCQCGAALSAPVCSPCCPLYRCFIHGPTLLRCLSFTLHVLLHFTPLTFSAQKLTLGAPSLLRLCSFMSSSSFASTPSLVLLAPSIDSTHSFMCSYHVSLALSMLSMLFLSLPLSFTSSSSESSLSTPRHLSRHSFYVLLALAHVLLLSLVFISQIFFEIKKFF